MLAVASGGGRFLLKGAAGALGLWLRPVLQQQSTCTSHVLQSWPGRGAQDSTSTIYTSHHAADASTLQRTLRRPSRLCSGIAIKLPSSLDAVPPQEGAGEWKSPSTPPNSESTLAKARRLARFDEEGEYRVFRELLEGEKTRFVSRVSYDGTNYKGFQLQSGLPTVQGVLEKALSQRFQTYVPVVAAGRTDTGVHSVGQAIHFDLPNADEDLGQLTYSMNQMMPEDVRVWNMSVAPPSEPWQVENGWPWSSMLNAHGKIYSYRLFVGEVPSPLDRLYRAHASKAAGSPIDTELLYRTIPKFVGEHDFAGFSNEVDRRATMKKKDGLGEFNTRRTVYSAEIIDEGGGNLRLEFRLDGALYRMVRNMVGTLLAVAAGRLKPEVVDEIFRTGVRDSCLIYAAPAHGLTLETVLYDGYGE